MRKIPEKFENPIDNIIYKTIDETSILFKRLNFTPNMITSLSALFGVLSIYSIYRNKFILSGVLYFISYYFDCLDGYYARKYNMVTKFGDYYDHIKDVIIFAGLVGILIKKRLFPGLIFLVPIIFLTCMHFGCQEIYYDKGESVTLNFTKHLCPCKKDGSNIEDILGYTRYFGSGSLVLLFCIYLVSLSFCFRK